MADFFRRVSLLEELIGIDRGLGAIFLRGSPTADFVGVNTLVADVAAEGMKPITLPGDAVAEGSLIASEEMDLGQYGLDVSHLTHTNLGGQGNIAPLVAKIGAKQPGISTSVLGLLGEDPFSKFVLDGFQKMGVGTEYAIIGDNPVGVCVLVQAQGAERKGLRYFPRANIFFGDDQTLNAIKTRLVLLNPSIAHNSYIGLSPRGWDLNEGGRAAEILSFEQELGSIVITDTHSFGTTSQPQFNLLREPLRFTNIFICSGGEAEGIMNTWKIPYDECSTEIEKAQTFLDCLMATYFSSRDGKPKLFGVSMKDGAVIACKDAGGRMIEPHFVPSPYKIPGKNLVGAGDALKAGIGSYVHINRERFLVGGFNFDEAVTFGALVATLYVTTERDRFGTARYDFIPPFHALHAVAKSPKEFTSLDALRNAVGLVNIRMRYTQQEP